MDTPEIIGRMLDGSRRERRELATQIVGYVDQAVHYALRVSRHPPENRDDLVSEVLLYLYRDDAKIVRRWDPKRAGLRGYLNMVSGRYVLRRRAGQPVVSPLAEEDPYLPEANMEDEFQYRAALEEIHDWVKTRGSDKDQARFESLLVQERPPTEVAREEGSTADSLYTWLSRFKRRAKTELPHLADLIERSR